MPGIFTVDLASEKVQHTGYYGYHQRYSPDGTKITFAAPKHKDGKWQIFVATLGAQQASVQITDTNVNQNHPAFTPDGKHVYFLYWRSEYTNATTGKIEHPNEVYRADVDGSNPVRITKRNAIAWHPEVFLVSQ